MSPIAGVASPEGTRPALASPAISPRRFRGRHRALCIARLSAGLRTRGREGRNECRGKRNEGRAATRLSPTRSSLLPTRSCHLLLVAASQDCAPVRVATSFPPTAAGQCRDGIIGSAPASLFIRRRKPTEPTATTYRGWIGWSTLHIQISRAAIRASAIVRHKPPRSGPPVAIDHDGVRISGCKHRTGSRKGRSERVEVQGTQPRPTTDAREVSALSSSRGRTFRSACIIPYRLPQFPPRPRALPRR